MESDRSRQSHSSPLREKSPSRLDPPHQPHPVPVLFRLQNVQRVPAAAPEAVAATEQFFASGMPAPVEDSRRTRMPSPPPPAAAPAELASLPRSPAASRPGVGAASHLPAPTVAGGAQPSATAAADSSSSSTKLGVAGGFILLGILVFVAFFLGRGSQQAMLPAPVPSEPPTVVAEVAAESTEVAAPIAPSASSQEELVIPQLPALSADVPAAEADREDGESSIPSPTAPPAPAISHDAPKQLVQDEQPAGRERSVAIELETPAMTETADEFGFRTIVNPAATAKAPAEVATKVQATSPSSSTVTPLAKPADAAMMVSAEPNLPSYQATSTPQPNFEQMYRMRLDYLSQQAALAQARPGSPQISNANAHAPSTMLTQPIANAVNNAANGVAVAAQTAGYGAASSGLPAGYPASSIPNSVSPSVPRQPYQPVYAQPVTAQPGMSPSMTGEQVSVPAPNSYQPIGPSLSPQGY